MAAHEFGIMWENPEIDHRYDKYEPEKYNCITVDDERMKLIAPHLKNADVFWHTLTRPEKGLACCGITLIPPTSIDDVMEVMAFVDDTAEGSQLKQLLLLAKSENKYIIHYGL